MTAAALSARAAIRAAGRWWVLRHQPPPAGIGAEWRPTACGAGDRSRRRRRRLIAAAAFAGLAGCGDGLGPVLLEVSVTASPSTAAPGEEISFVVNARGGNLFGVEINYGDGGSDLYPAAGARTARVTFRHAYIAAGVYQVRASAVDAVAGSKDAEIEIRVQ